MEPINGVHILGRVYVPGGLTLRPTAWYVEEILKVIRGNGLTPVGSPGSFDFEGGGFTAFFMLAESHLSLHTWIELGFVDLDVFVCNVTRDNSDKARLIFREVGSLFEAVKIKAQEIFR